MEYGAWAQRGRGCHLLYVFTAISTKYPLPWSSEKKVLKIMKTNTYSMDVVRGCHFHFSWKNQHQFYWYHPIDSKCRAMSHLTQMKDFFSSQGSRMPNRKKTRERISLYLLWVLGFWCKAPAPFKWLLLCRILLNRPRCGTGKADTRDKHWGKTPWSPTEWDTVAAQIVTVMQKNKKHPYNTTNNRQKKRLISSAGKHSQQSKQNCIDQLHRGLRMSL